MLAVAAKVAAGLEEAEAAKMVEVGTATDAAEAEALVVAA
jgi:hypothetical protein